MGKVSTYLNFARETEEAFNFYKQVFGTEFEGEINRMGEVPPQEGQPPVAEGDKNLVMHIALPILGGHVLHGTDAPESMGFKVNFGNTMYIMLEPDTREEADKLFKSLSEGGEIEMEMAEQFWGDYFGSFKDKYGTAWMVNCSGKNS
jgi:PhnB protein